MYIDDTEVAVRGFEGAIPWMYRDTRGFVTGAIGLLIPNVDFAVTLPFQTLTGEVASAEWVRHDFARVIALPPARVAGYYRCSTSLVLSAAAMDKLLTDYLAAEDGKLTQIYGAAYSTAPDAAKTALLDLGYNCGTESLATQWPHLHDAVEAQDWSRCADNCTRPKAPAARNLWTRNQFLKAQQGR